MDGDRPCINSQDTLGMTYEELLNADAIVIVEPVDPPDEES